MNKKKTNKPETMKESVPLTFGEEVGNSVSHGVMFFLLLFTLPYYAIRAYLQGGVRLAAGISIYFFCMMFMFGGSCLYHIMPYHTTYKLVFRKLDHMMILLAIAGTYTPICLYLLNNWVGWTVLAVEWLMVLAGILLKSLSKKRYKKISLTIYLVMGWMAVFILPVLLTKASPMFLTLIAAGGLFYTAGIWFYIHPEKHFFHFTWHIFIILASLCHLAAILYFM